jgi:hypothetical protein
VQQQLSILSASNLYEQSPRSDARLLMEADSSQSLVVTQRSKSPRPTSLRSYQDEDLRSLDTSVYTEANGLPAVFNIASSRAEHLLQQWTSLPLFERRLRDEERELQRQRQEYQQATVESDSEEEQSRTSKLSGDGARRTQRSGSMQPLFMEVNGLSSPPQEKQYGASAPPTPIASPRTSRTNMPPTTNDQYTATSPRSSLGSLPVEAAAAVEAKEEDSEVDLEIPWKLCTRKYYWRFIDAKLVSSNTDQAYSLAYLERNSWTEIMASWVCKEAIREAGLRFTHYQKERKDNRKTRGEMCFCIERPLQFDQVKRLVERTVDIYRKAAPPTPPQQPQARRSSFHRPPPPSTTLKAGTFDRDRTPVPRNTHPPLDRSNSSMHFAPPPGPPPLDRSLSVPGPGLIPPPPQQTFNPRTLNLQIPGQYAPQQPSRPHSPRLPQYPPQANGYPSQPMNTTAAPPYYPPPPNNPFTNTPLSAHAQVQNPNYPIQASPLRQSYMNPSFAGNRRYDDDFTTSESELERPRRRRSKSKSRTYEKERERERDKYGKKSHMGRKAAAGALLGVGGLTALLDGLSGL